MTMKKSLISVIIPAHNEEEAVGQVVDEVKKILKKENVVFEIIVVDDGSTDKTSQIAKKAGAEVITSLCQGGSGTARKTGLKQAKGEIVVMLDADGSYNPQTIVLQ